MQITAQMLLKECLATGATLADVARQTGLAYTTLWRIQVKSVNGPRARRLLTDCLLQLKDRQASVDKIFSEKHQND
jgi:hypothetical protein